jgi:predicted ATPase
MPADVDFRESEGRVYFVQTETGLKYPVHQVGASSGTLRILALMTALLGEGVGSLVGIEEPENYVHPAGLAAFAEHLLKARDRAQILITTHSPLLLDFLDDPEAVCVVRRDPEKGTVIVREQRPEAVREALEASGFRLGELHQTKGFGA